jgi:endonuclease YncB( thermonuclease family)
LAANAVPLPQPRVWRDPLRAPAAFRGLAALPDWLQRCAVSVVKFKQKQAGRPLMIVATALALLVLVLLVHKGLLGVMPWEARLTSLPNIVRGPGDHAIEPNAIRVVDGDTIVAHGRTVRLVGFDAPESDLLARCARERELSERATAKLSTLIAGGGLELRLVACACPAGTEGTRYCNHGRACGVLTAQGKDVGATLIQEGLARPYICGSTSCPRRDLWC